MLDRYLRSTFANFSTLFLIVFMVAAPLHLAYSFVFRDVIATHELHDTIETFPNYRQVRSVGPPTLERERVVFWVIAVIELLLLPAAAAAARRALAVSADGGVPTAVDSWRHLRSPGSLPPDLETNDRTRAWVSALAGVAIAAAVAVTAETTVNGVAIVVPEDLRWMVVGAGQALSRSLGIPFLLVPLGAAAAAKAHPPRTPKLY